MVAGDELQDIDSATRNFLSLAADERIVSAMDGDEFLLAPALERSAETLQKRSNELLHRLLPQAPVLSFRLTNPNKWFTGSRPTWSAVVPGAELSLDHLSEAESKWSRVAISLAMASSDTRADPSALFLAVLDEPERGLHGHAEANLTEALVEISRELHCMVVAATHSAALLNAQAADKHHLVTGAAGNIRSLRLLDDDLVLSFRDVRYGEQEVGLTAAEILHMVRVFVVVEGPHDQVVLEHLLGPDLAAAGAVLVHTAGAKNLPELTRAQLIWDFTDADVVVVLDGISVEAVIPLWEKAKEAARAGNKAKAQQVLRGLERLPGGEPRWLRELLGRAVESGQWERVHPRPLSMPDIVCYVPPDSLGLSEGWEALIQAWRRASGGRPVDLKSWLAQKYKISLGLRTLRRAVKLAVPTREIQDLGLEIRLISGMRGLKPRD